MALVSGFIRRGFPLAVACGVSLQATVLGGIRTPAIVVISADAQVSDGISGAKVGETCKIRTDNDAIVGVTGVASEPNVGFDPFALVSNLVKSGVNNELLSRFVADTRSKLLLAANWNAQHQPKIYRSRYLDKPPLIAYIGWLNGQELMARTMYFTVVGTDKEASNVTERDENCPGECEDDGIMMFAGGHKNETEAYKNAQKEKYGIDPVKDVRSFVEMHISLAPNDYSGPIQTIQLNRNGVRWIDRPKLCFPPGSP